MQKSAKTPKIERTLVIIKRDGIERGLWQPIMQSIRKRGLEVSVSWGGIPQREDMSSIYGPQHSKQDYFDELVSYMSTGDAEIMLVEGVGAVKKMMSLKELVRERFKSEHVVFPGFKVQMQNVLHCSDEESAGREVYYFTRVSPLLRVNGACRPAL